MPICEKHKAPFLYDSFYHVYNRSVSGQLLFYSEENYRFFLNKFDTYMSDLIRVYSWSLMPNHFHFLLSIKRENECRFTEKEKKQLDSGDYCLSDIVSSRFKNFFICYSLSLKNMFKIKTNIFAQKFKHILVEDESYLTQLVYYIHYNPARHHIVKDWTSYKWSSYKRIISDVRTRLEVKFVLDWFGGKDNFIKYHAMQHDQFDCGFDD
jgi:REP element-mobilizing transposase RayT